MSPKVWRRQPIVPHALIAGTNFTFEERDAKRIEGLLPPVYETLDMQAERCAAAPRSCVRARPAPTGCALQPNAAAPCHNRRLMAQLREPHLRDLERYNILKVGVA